jgi:hypothetical protein
MGARGGLQQLPAQFVSGFTIGDMTPISTAALATARGKAGNHLPMQKRLKRRSRMSSV